MSEKNNAYVVPCAFDSMTPKEKRIAIAKDVIAGLESKRLNAVTGSFITPVYSALKPRIYVSKKIVSLQTVLNEEVESCQVCAKGALLIAMVEKFNHVYLDLGAKRPWESNFGSSRIQDALEGIFSDIQLDLMELTFEWATTGRAYISYSDSEAAWDFRVANAGSPNIRLRSIMQNVIDNDGEFVPTKHNKEIAYA